MLSEYVTLARQKGDIWHAGSITNWNARTESFDLSFLGDGDFKDGINADRVVATIDVKSRQYQQVGNYLF